MIKNCIDKALANEFKAELCGIDEAGRGPLVGPVIAAAAYLPVNFPEHLRQHLNDSKKISEKKRETLATQLKSQLIYGIGEATAEEIDAINILQASLLAMQRAFNTLMTQAFSANIQLALIDGNQAPALPIQTYPIIKGDQKSQSIAAASILAKTHRDTHLKMLAAEFPQYGWEKNKGYPTATHIEALRKYGPTPFHRRSFNPIKTLLDAA